MTTRRHSPRKLALWISLPAIGVAAWWLWTPMTLWYYSSIVDEIRSSPKGQDRLQAFESKYDCIIDSGPPLRVAFRRPGGIMDNWVGIVYDPTGDVLKARQFKADFSNWGDPALQDVKKLFRGQMRWAEPLGGPWYRCWFTQFIYNFILA